MATTLDQYWALQRNADDGGSLPANMVGWTLVNVQLSNPTDGFDAKAYIGPEGQVVLAFQAAYPITAPDQIAIEQILKGEEPTQYASAIDAVSRLRQAVGSVPITVIGDSLGGALAQLVVSREGVSENLTAITWGAVGIRSLTANDPVRNEHLIKAYVIAVDPAAGPNGGQLGDVERLPAHPASPFFSIPIGQPPVTILQLMFNLYFNHMRSSYGDAIGRAGIGSQPVQFPLEPSLPSTEESLLDGIEFETAVNGTEVTVTGRRSTTGEIAGQVRAYLDPESDRIVRGHITDESGQRDFVFGYEDGGGLPSSVRASWSFGGLVVDRINPDGVTTTRLVVTSVGGQQVVARYRIDAVGQETIDAVVAINGTPPIDEESVIRLLQEAGLGSDDLVRVSDGSWAVENGGLTVSDIIKRERIGEAVADYGVEGNSGFQFATQIGSALGSFLGNKLLDVWGVDNVAVRLGIGAVTSALGSWIGDSLLRGLSEGPENILSPFRFFDNFGGSLITSAVNLGGAALGRALVGAIGLQNDPLANGLASIFGGALAQYGAIQIVTTLFPQTGMQVLADFGLFGVQNLPIYGPVLPGAPTTVAVPPSIGGALTNAGAGFIGSFAGGKLAAAVFKGDPQSIAFGSSIGGAIGSMIGGIAAVGNFFAGLLGVGAAAGGPIGVLVLAFVGAFLGGALGSLLGPKQSSGDASLVFENGLLQFGQTSGDGKALTTAVKLVGAALQIESSLINGIGGRLVGVDALTIGMNEAEKKIYAQVGTFYYEGEAEAVLEQGAIAQLKKARIAGGDFMSKRVLERSDADTRQELADDLSLANLYALYDDNKALFDAQLGEIMASRGGAGSWAGQKARAEGQLDLDGAFIAATYRANSQTPIYVDPNVQTLVSSIAAPTGTPPTPTAMGTASMAFGASLIAFDLNRDGVVAQSVESSGALFDIDGDGFKEQTGWLTPFDGFLVFDTNGNGQIDSVAEMVVSQQWRAADGSMLGISLASLDIDGDGYFDADDVVVGNNPLFFSARLWTDRNLNGSVDLGELWSLTRFNIDHIALKGTLTGADSADWRDTAGNKIAWESRFGINGTETSNFGFFTTLSLAYNTKGVKTVVDPDHPGWFLLEHENGQKTAFGLGNTGLDLVGDATFARTLFGTEGIDELTAGDVPGAAAGVPGLFIDGKTGNDVITGSAADDVLSGGKGSDHIFGGDGNDVIIADEEDMILADGRYVLTSATGGAGKDVLIFETADRTADHTPRDLILDISSLGFEIAIGGKGNDQLWASVDGAGIAGGEGDDTITGTAGADRLEGDEGSDTIVGGAGDDVLSGGAGVDALDAGDGNDILYVDAADFADGVQRVTGGAGQDTLVVEGDVGARIDLSATNVEIAIGSEGDDTLRAGAGADAKVLYGEGGDDTLVSGAGADEIVGGDGIDLVSYADSNAAVTVNLGTKTWSGGFAAGDVLAGIEGVTGTQFVDTLTGDAGDNILEGGAGGDTLDGGDGRDTASYRSSDAAVQIDLSGATPVVAGGHAAGDTLINIENVIGSGAADVLIGSDLDNVLEGGGGADTIVGGAGNDTASYRSSLAGVSVNLRTGTGTGGDAEGDQLSGIENLTGSRFDDVLTVGAGINVVDGGAGKDTVSYAGATAAVDVNLALGHGLAGDATGDTYLNIENIQGGSCDDVLTGDGNANVIEGGDGNDTLRGGGGGDTLRGGLGNDTYSFGLGDGVVIVEDIGGLDAVSFRDGLKLEDLTIEVVPIKDQNGAVLSRDLFIALKDTNKPYASAPELSDRLVIKNGANDLARVERLLFASGEYRLQAIGADQERLVGSSGSDLLVGDERGNTLEGGEGDDWLFGAAGDDWLLGGDGQDVLQGGEGRDWLFGGSGDDLIFGGVGDDVLIGGSGDDVLVGGPGNDQIEGGPGNDVLDGGEGDDVLQGGTGFDVFVQQKGGGVDRIGDEDGYGQMVFRVDTTFYGISNTGSLNAVFGNWANFIGVTPQPDPIPNVSWIVGNNLYFGGQTYTFGILPTELQGRSTDLSPDLIIRSSLNSPRTLFTPGYWIRGLAPNEYQAAFVTNFQENWAPNRPTPPMPYAGININTGDTPEALMWGFEMKYYIKVDDFGGSDLVTGTEGADTLNAEGGSDKIYGYGGTDTLDGGEGNDALSGGDGNDLLLGGVGDDSIDGGRDNDTAYGGDGNDTIAGGSGDDLLYGEEGQDRLDGGSGADQLFGGNGNDQLAGGAGNDTLQGEAGDDKLYGDAGDDLLLGAEGDDELSAGDGVDRLEGGVGHDTLFGGNGDDLLLGQEGDDRLYGNAGKDRLEGGDGNDELVGGDGRDLLLGGAGNDNLSGSAGDDIVRGEDGEDRLWGGAGQDRLEGGAGDDQVDGEAGDDTILGGDGNDTLVGSEGIDLVRGEAGDDRLFGGSEDDSLLGGEGGDTLSGWTGADILWGQAGDDALSGGDGNDRLFGGLGDDAVLGGNGDDDLSGGDGKDALSGDAGNDRLFGGAGVDILQGDDGDDQLIGGADIDFLYGGAGNDRLWGGTDADVLSGGDGNDTLRGEAGDDQLGGDAGADTLLGGTGNDALAGGADNDLLLGGDGNDRLAGDTGDDELQGEAGNDELAGGSGNDRLFGGLGDDTAFGGEGDDQLRGGEGHDLLRGEAGNDALWGEAGNDALSGGDGDDAIDGGAGNDTADGGDGNDLLLGGEGDDVLAGEAGADRLAGGTGQDTLYGGADGDALDGGAGDDVLRGEAGDDRLEGGAGNDDLAGGAGSDAFVFRAGFGVDRIADFSTAEDWIDLVGLTLAQVAITDELGGARLTAGADSVFVAGVTAADLGVRVRSVADAPATVDAAAMPAMPTASTVADKAAPLEPLVLAWNRVDENAAGEVVGELVLDPAPAGTTRSFALSDDRFEVVDGVLKLKADRSVDHEAEPVILLTVTVTEVAGEGLAVVRSQQFQLVTTNVNEAPTSIVVTPSSVIENAKGALVGILAVSDPDAGDSVTFTASNERFEVVGNQLRLKADQSLDFENQNSFAVTVTATDADGLSLTQTLAIGVIDVAEKPNGIFLSNATVQRDTDGAVVGTVTATDQDAGSVLTLDVLDPRFEIVNGELKLKAGQSLGSAERPWLELLVRATDQTGLVRTEAFSVLLADASGTTAPHADWRDALGRMTNQVIDLGDGTEQRLAFDVTDTNAWAVQSERWQKSITTGPANSSYTSYTEQKYYLSAQELETGIERTDVVIVSQLIYDGNGATGYYVVIGVQQVHYVQAYTTYDSYRLSSTTLNDDGNGATTTDPTSPPGTPVAGGDQPWTTRTVTYVDGQYQKTEFAYDPMAATVAENQASEVAVGTLTIIDPLPGVTRSYAVSDSRFELVGKQLKLKAGNALDYEAASAPISVTVTATDSDGVVSRQEIRVTVGNANETPTDIALSPDVILVNVPGALIGTLTVTDPDAGDSHRFAVSDDRFEVVNGQLKLKAGQSLSGTNGSTIAIVLTATDDGGLSTTKTLTLRLLAAPSIALAVDTGVSAADGLTSNGQIEVTGLLAGASWQYSLDGGQSWMAGTGTSISSSAFGADGPWTVLVRQTDMAGFISPSASLNFTLDRQAPAAPTVVLYSDTGSSAADGVTANGQVVIGGLEASARWQYSLDGGQSWNGGVGTSIDAAVFGADGGQSVLVRQIDAAGNASQAAALSFVLDRQAPVTPTAVLRADTGSSSADAITSNGQVDISGLEAGTSWQYSLNGGQNWTAGTGTSIDASALGADGAKTLLVRQADVAGNVSSAGSLSFILDRQAPAASTLALRYDTGESPIDRLTDDAQVEVRGLEANLPWEYSVDFGQTWTTGAAPSNGVGSILASAFGASGSKMVQVRQVDTAGNSSQLSSLSFTLVPGRPPAAPIVRLAVDAGLSIIDGKTNNGQIDIDGLEAGATWQYSLNSGSTWTTGSGRSIPASVFASDGLKQLQVRQTNASGQSPVASYSFNLDRAAPTTPLLSLQADTGASATDRVTGNAQVNVGGLESGGLWQYSLDGGQSWTTSKTVGVSGSIPASVFGAAGVKTVQVRQTDVAGNVSPTASFSFTLQGPPVLLPAAPVVRLAVDAGLSIIDGKTNNGQVDVDGLEAGATWQYSLNSGATWTTGSGQSIPASVFASDGLKLLQVRQITANGQSPAIGFSFNLDRAAPTTPLLSLQADTGASATDLVTSNGQVNVGGLEYGGLWQYSLDSGQNWTTSKTLGVSGSIPAAVFGAVGVKTVQVRQTDVAGNVSPTASFSFTLEAPPPALPAAPAVRLAVDAGLSIIDGKTNNGQVDVDGLEVGATWQYSLNSGVTWTTGSGRSIPTSALGGDGNKTLQVRQTNASGQSPTTSYSFYLDRTAPTTPVLSLQADTGASASDLVTSNALVNVSGLESISLWQYSLDGGQNWTMGSDKMIPAAVFGSDGVKAVQVRQTDEAGNVSPTASFSFTLQGPPSPPPVAPIVRLAEDTGSDAVDLVTNNGRVEIDGLEAGASWQYSLNSGSTWTTGSGRSILATALGGDGSKNLQVQQIGANGDRSPVTSYSFSLDLAAPTIPLLSLQADTGASAMDRVTGNAQVIVGGLQNGVGLWQYSLDGGQSWATGAPVVSSMGSIPASVFGSDGVKIVLVRQFDQAGNVSPTASISFVRDARGDQFNVSGGAGADVLSGTPGDDSLRGLTGNDTLEGGAGDDILLGSDGNDILRGGLGSDIYAFARGDGNDTVQADSNDTIFFGASIARDQLWFTRSSNDLVISVIGQDQTATVSAWYDSPGNQVARIVIGDGSLITDAGMEQMVQAMASFTPPASGQTTLPSNLATSLAPALAANWQHT